LVIRCERCSTLYELDETLLAPDGSQVQCTRCDHVFTARPPAPAEPTEPRAPSGSPAFTSAELEIAVAATSGAPLDPPTPDAAAIGDVKPPPPSPRADASRPRTPAPEPRYVRAGPPAVYRPTPGPTSVRAHPVLRRDTVGAFESRLRWSARMRWLLPAAAVGLVALGAAGFFFVRGRWAASAASARAEGAANARPAGLGAGGEALSARPPSAPPPTAPPPAASPAEPPPGNAAPPARKSIAQRPPIATPGGAAGVGASGAQAPAALGGATTAPAPSLGGEASTSRGLAPSALTPASIPDVAPASGMPQVAPPIATEGSRHPSREPAVQDEPIGGG
jgi:predicted Zn finger-like uncharacterized protein